jgi:hypothetical protein
MGFPQIQSNSLCFFSGRISASDVKAGSYLVDGVAIHGVSGGPSVLVEDDNALIVGVVSSYLPNQTAGGTLPGLCFLAGVSQLQRSIKTLSNMEEAKEQQPRPEGSLPRSDEPPTS